MSQKTYTGIRSIMAHKKLKCGRVVDLLFEYYAENNAAEMVNILLGQPKEKAPEVEKSQSPSEALKE